MFEKLKELSVEHPYYCSDSNYYSNDANSHYNNMTQFLDDWEDADPEYNLMFRWDIINYSETEEGVEAGRYRAELFFMLQRKGIFKPVIIDNVNEVEAERFEKFAKVHWELLKKMWLPLPDD